MCSLRIRQRLRFVSIKGKTPKKPIKESLRHAVQCVKRINTGTILDTDIQHDITLFTIIATNVVKLIDSWHGHQTAARLSDLVNGIYRLSQIGKLHALLDLIPNRDIEPTAKISLQNVISKVARYRESARLLYRTAKKFVIARRMKSIPIKLPQETFSFPLVSKPASVLRSTVDRIDQKYRKQKEFNEIWKLLNITSEEATRQFSSQVHRTLRDAKIHAEIQLIAHYELERPVFLPRVICSSKDACVLCNIFVRMYGKIHTPRSHGRLYPGWRLPNLPRPNDLQRRFNKILEGYIKQSLSTLMLRRRKILYPCPNESTLLTLVLSETTKESSVQLELNTQSDKNSYTTLPDTRAPHTLVECPSRARPRSLFTAGKDILQSEYPSSAKYHQPQSTGVLGDRRKLPQGLMLSGYVNSSTSSPKYVASSLRLQIECAISSRDIAYGVEWLTCDEAMKVKKEYNSALIIDAEVLAGEVCLHDQSSIYIATKKAMIRLDWHV